MECQSLFSRGKKIGLSSDKFARRVLSVNLNS